MPAMAGSEKSVADSAHCPLSSEPTVAPMHVGWQFPQSCAASNEKHPSKAVACANVTPALCTSSPLQTCHPCAQSAAALGPLISPLHSPSHAAIRGHRLLSVSPSRVRSAQPVSIQHTTPVKSSYHEHPFRLGSFGASVRPVSKQDVPGDPVRRVQPEPMHSMSGSV